MNCLRFEVKESKVKRPGRTPVPGSADFLATHARRRLRIIAVGAPGGMAEMDDEIAVTRITALSNVRVPIFRQSLKVRLSRKAGPLVVP